MAAEAASICGSLPSYAVTSGRCVLALLLSPLGSLTLALMTAVSATKRVSQLISAAGGEDTGAAAASTSASTRVLQVIAAVIVAPMGLLVGGFLGLFVAPALWALYGPAAPEEPWSAKPAASNPRQMVQPREEEASSEIRRHNDGILAFGSEMLLQEGGREVHCHSVFPPGRSKVRGIVLIYHGLHSHGGSPRALRVAVHLAREGFGCYLPDALGHGRSSGPSAVVYSFDEIVGTLNWVTEELMQKRHRDSAWFLQGESMGGLMVLLCARSLSGDLLSRLSGINAVCPALMVAEEAGNKALEEVAQMLPFTFLTKFICPRLPAKPGPKGNIFPEEQSLRDHAQAEIDADPLEYTGDTKYATATTFQQALLVESNRKELVRSIQELDKPVLLIHGTADKTVDVNCSRELLRGLQSADKTLLEYEGKCHVLLSEDEETRERYLKDVASFCTKHSP